jgi:hypothetical protein
MAAQAKADTSELTAAIGDLKAREAALIASDADVKPPRPPRVEGLHPGGDDDEASLAPEDLLELDMARGRGPPKDRRPPMDKAEREAMMAASRERLDRLRDMSPEERVAEMRRERDERLANRGPDELGLPEELAPRARDAVDRAKSKLRELPPEERHAKLMEHQANMEGHRAAMEAWRDKHEAHMNERRAIMDGYRDLSHQVREAVFASRPL